ncbi:MAG TPA: hypothetical protein VFJ10_15965 [Acidobacteriaceae bacterium]|jgi:tellurite resistance protein TehA-like permease|nr:hypothetical protein [Acidobacteriaceae bacterium]
MMNTALLWIVVLVSALGIGMFWIGLNSLEDNDRPALSFISWGAGLVILCLAATFWPK